MKNFLVSYLEAVPSAALRLFTPAIVAAFILFGACHGNAAVTLTDIGGTAPTPGANDISQLSTSGNSGSPNSKNYYSNNSPAPGEKFITGANASGYTMTDIYVDTGNGNGNGIGGTTAWTLYIYSVSGTSATLLTSYSGLTSGSALNNGDWLHFSGLSIPLAANTTYAYAVSSGSSAYSGLENSTTTLTGANALLLPTGGGTVTTVTGFNGVFDVGLSLGMSGSVSEQSGAPTPGANDVSQLSTTADTANPNSKNYFCNDNSSSIPVPPGEEFTTPNSNPGGYTLTNLYIQTGNGSGNGIGALTPWTLYVFSVSGSTATLLQSYSGILGSSFTAGGWIHFSNLSVNMAANATYAFGLSTSGNASGPYTGLENTTTALTGGNAVLVNASSGAITLVTGFNGVFDAGLSPIAAPGPPTAVMAAPGNNLVTLSWTAPGGTVSGYNVYRSTISGAGYTLLAAGANVSGSPFTDSTAANGTTYYYVVTSLNGSLESSDSSQVSATPPRANETVTWNGIQTSDNNWTLSTSEGNWLGTGTTFYENQDAAIFNDDASSGAQTVNLNVTLDPGSVMFQNTNAIYTISGSGAISGSAGVTNSGPGTVMLAETGGDNFSGGVAVSGGTLILDDTSSAIAGGTTIASGATLQVGNNDGNGSLPAGSVTNNGTLVFDRNDSSLIEGNVISGTGNIIQEGNGTVQLAGNSSFTGTVLVTNNSTLRIGSTTALGTAAGTTTVANGSTLDLDFGGSIAEPIFVQGTGSGGNGAIVDNLNGGDPTLSAITLTGDTTFGGSSRWDVSGLSTGGNAYNLTIAGGAYHEFSNANIDTNLANITITGSGTTFGDKGTTGLGNPADTVEIQSGATLEFWNNGGANVTLNKNVLIDSSGTLQNGAGAHQIVGPVTLGSGVCFFQIGSSSLALNGALNGSGILDLLNTSTGTLAINGNGSSFSGGAYVYGGELLVNGVFGSAVICEAGGTLAGNGTVSGLADIFGALLPGTAGTSGTFNAAGGLTLESGATLTNDLSTTVNGTNDLVVVTGDLTVNGNTIVLNPLHGSLQNGVYPLITYTGNLNGSFNGVQTVSPSAYTLTLTNITTTTPKEIAVVVFGTPSQLTWDNNSGDGEWNAGGSFNWTNRASQDVEQFFNADSVTFDDSVTNSINAALPTSTNIDIASGQTLLPAAFTNNSTVDYIISGAGEISGGVNLVKAGASTLTISNINNFSGGVTINGGTVLAYGSGGNTALGSGTPVINSGGTLIGMDGDAFGYTPNAAPTNIFINGGTVSDLGNSSYRITMPNITFMGGTLTSAATNSGDANGNYSTFGNGSACAITTLATNTTAVISAATMGFGKPTAFTVAAGTITGGSTPGVDLLLTSKLVPYGLQPITKAGPGVMAIDNTNSATWGDPILVSAGTLQLGTTNDTNFLVSPVGAIGVTNNGTILFASSESVSIPNGISGSGNLVVKSGAASLSGANTYTGNTLVNSGTLALMGSGSIASTPEIIFAGGTTFDVSALSTAFTLASGQVLSNSASPVAIKGAANTGSGTLGLNLAVGTAPLNITSGTLTLAASTVVNINNTSSALAAGTYTIVAANGGTVAGTAPSSVTVSGNGTSGNLPASLQINSGALTLVVGAVASPATITGINISGSTLTITATNGADGGQYVLLESSNLLRPLNQWIPVLTNNFDGSGHLNLSTNIINSQNPREFYLLQMP